MTIENLSYNFDRNFEGYVTSEEDVQMWNQAVDDFFDRKIDARNAYYALGSSVEKKYPKAIKFYVLFALNLREHENLDACIEMVRAEDPAYGGFLSDIYTQELEGEINEQAALKAAKAGSLVSEYRYYSLKRRQAQSLLLRRYYGLKRIWTHFKIDISRPDEIDRNKNTETHDDFCIVHPRSR